MNRFLSTSFWLFIAFIGKAQFTIGRPEVTSYTKQVYRGGAQTRQIAQDKNGILYFANDEGVLTFNSARWQNHPLPNKSLVRCLEFGPDDKLYVGGQDEFGYFSPAANGSLQYYSLKHLIPPEARSFADVWEICIASDAVFFQTIDRIYELRQGRIVVYNDSHWRFMGKAGNELIAQSFTRGLLRFQNRQWVPYSTLANQILPADYFATSLTLLSPDSILLTTLKHGVYLLKENKVLKWELPLLNQIGSKNISSSSMVNQHQVAIGTNLDGCFIIDKNGKLIQHLSRRGGMQDNSILTIFLDQQKNIWFGLHNGIDFIPYNNAIKHINPASLNEGTGFSSIIFKNNLYTGTSIGLFKFPLAGEKELGAIQAEAIPVKNSTGEVWNLSEVNGQLLMGHNEGAFIIQDNEATKFETNTGYWNFQSFKTAELPFAMVAGTYRGITFFNQHNNSFSKIAGEAIIESARFVTVAHNRVWFSHPYKGIYAVTLKDSATTFKKYSKREGLASDNNNYLFKIKNALVLTTENGIFEYNATKDAFQPSTFYNKHLSRFPIRYLKEDAEGNVWFVFEKKVGVLDLATGKPTIIYFPELTNKFVAGFEHINPIDKNNILIGGEKGFYHINYGQYKKLKYPLQVIISTVSAGNKYDSLLFGGFTGSLNSGQSVKLKPAEISHSFNSLHFEFASPVYGQSANIDYSYYLQGFDNSWSDYTRKTEKDYTNLQAGQYVFKVKARNNLGNESPVNEYVFTILPPWYKTKIAYLVYALLILTGIYLLYGYQQKKFTAQQIKHNEEQRKLQYLHQLELEKAEKELVELRNAKLEAEIINKNTELASASMHLVQKTDVLLKIKEQMTKLKDTAADNKPDLKNILKTLNEENKMQEQWQQFSIHFDSVHHNFLATLKAKFPDLSQNDQKLCAYLKMNLSTKEIAQLMNISVRGVEISRYRLRKKLGVKAGTHLFNFLDTVNSNLPDTKKDR